MTDRTCSHRCTSARWRGFKPTRCRPRNSIHYSMVAKRLYSSSGVDSCGASPVTSVIPVAAIPAADAMEPNPRLRIHCQWAAPALRSRIAGRCGPGAEDAHYRFLPCGHPVVHVGVRIAIPGHSSSSLPPSLAPGRRTAISPKKTQGRSQVFLPPSGGGSGPLPLQGGGLSNTQGRSQVFLPPSGGGGGTLTPPGGSPTNTQGRSQVFLPPSWGDSGPLPLPGGAHHCQHAGSNRR